jgi:hypothetical protein
MRRSTFLPSYQSPRPPERPSPAPFATGVVAKAQTLDDALKFTVAADASPPRRPGGNTAALASPSTTAAFATLFSDFESGALSLEGFRVRMRALGLAETPESSRILSQPGRVRLAELKTALRRSGVEDGGNEGLGGGGGTAAGSSRAYFSTAALGDIDNRAAGRALGLVARGEGAVPGAFEETGAGALLRGEGAALPRSATNELSPTGEMATNPYKMRSRQADYVDSASMRDALTSAHVMSPSTDGRRARARSLLSQIDAGAVREADIPARLRECGFSMDDVADLAPLLRNFYKTGKLDVQRARAYGERHCAAAFLLIFITPCPLRTTAVHVLNAAITAAEPSRGGVDGLGQALHDAAVFCSPGAASSKNAESASAPASQYGSRAWLREHPHTEPAGHEHDRHHYVPPEEDTKLSRPARYAAARHKALGTTEFASPPPPPPNRRVPYAENDNASLTSASAAWGRPLGGPMAYGIFQDPHSPPQCADFIARRRADVDEMSAQISRGIELAEESLDPTIFLSPTRLKMSEGYKFTT